MFLSSIRMMVELTVMFARSWAERIGRIRSEWSTSWTLSPCWPPGAGAARPRRGCRGEVAARRPIGPATRSTARPRRALARSIGPPAEKGPQRVRARFGNIPVPVLPCTAPARSAANDRDASRPALLRESLPHPCGWDFPGVSCLPASSLRTQALEPYKFGTSSITPIPSSPAVGSGKGALFWPSSGGATGGGSSFSGSGA